MVPAWMLVTDVDDTLIGDDAALERLAERTRSAPLRVVLNSSRPVNSLSQGLNLPDSLPLVGMIGALGTELAWTDGRRDAQWEEQFQGFPRSVISSTLEAFGPAHDVEFQGPAKVSHAIPRYAWDPAERAMGSRGAGLRVVTSGHSNFDVIPQTAGKSAATRYVAARCQIPWDRVVTAGDGEIDAGMLTSSKGIVVGNATERFRDRMAGRAYVATGTHAMGILEGLNHYRVLMTSAHHV